jgi:hypothetical protein
MSEKKGPFDGAKGTVTCGLDKWTTQRNEEEMTTMHSVNPEWLKKKDAKELKKLIAEDDRLIASLERKIESQEGKKKRLANSVSLLNKANKTKNEGRIADYYKQIITCDGEIRKLEAQILKTRQRRFLYSDLLNERNLHSRENRLTQCVESASELIKKVNKDGKEATDDFKKYNEESKKKDAMIQQIGKEIIIESDKEKEEAKKIVRYVASEALIKEGLDPNLSSSSDLFNSSNLSNSFNLFDSSENENEKDKKNQLKKLEEQKQLLKKGEGSLENGEKVLEKERLKLEQQQKKVMPKFKDNMEEINNSSNTVIDGLNLNKIGKEDGVSVLLENVAKDLFENSSEEKPIIPQN